MARQVQCVPSSNRSQTFLQPAERRSVRCRPHELSRRKADLNNMAELGHHAPKKLGRPKSLKKANGAAKKASGAARKNGKKSAVKAKYRDGKTGDTWSGRGRMASWLKSKQDAGEKIEKYLLN